MSERTPPAVDLSACDREPIHIPGAIQPHGVLLAATGTDLRVMVASANLEQHLPVAAEAALGQPLASIVGRPAADELAAIVEAQAWSERNPLAIEVAGRRFDGVVHAHQGAAILELEPAPPPARDPLLALRGALHGLQRLDSIAALEAALVRHVRALTGFERVMVYRFDEDGHGAVAAEEVAGGLEPYLGLHYPASDIPRQARELYLSNWLRIIPDARYAPAALVPAVRPDTGQPLDLTYSILRSVSPVHLEYLGNMGARASMSISLVVRDRLWGLISCLHHRGPHPVPYSVRTTCEVVGRLASLQIAALEDRELARGRSERAGARATLAAAMRAAREGGDLLQALADHPREWLGSVQASGAAVVTQDDAIATAGACPPEERLRALVAALGGRGADVPWATDSLPAEIPEAAPDAALAGGLLTFALPGAPSRRVLWFRPEVVHTVSWGGDPRKPIDPDPSMRIHPRRSFARWKEEVRLRSRRWSPADLEAAGELRQAILEIDLERQFSRAMQAVRIRDDMVAVVSHDLRGPLNVIQLQADALQLQGTQPSDGGRLRPAADRIQRAVTYMNSLIADLLDLAKLQAGQLALHRDRHDIRQLIHDAIEMLRPLADAKHIAVVQAGTGGAVARVDRDRMFQVLANLIGNGIKFTPEAGTITVESTAAADGVVVTVADTGPGIPPADLTQVFDRYWQARRSGREGAGLGLAIAKGIVEAHGGRIWVESEPDRGARFSLQIPADRS